MNCRTQKNAEIAILQAYVIFFVKNLFSIFDEETEELAVSV